MVIAFVIPEQAFDGISIQPWTLDNESNNSSIERERERDICVCVCIYIYICVCVYIYICICDPGSRIPVLGSPTPAPPRPGSRSHQIPVTSLPKHGGVTHHKQTQTHTTPQGREGGDHPKQTQPRTTPHHRKVGKQPTTTPHHGRGGGGGEPLGREAACTGIIEIIEVVFV